MSRKIVAVIAALSMLLVSGCKKKPKKPTNKPPASNAASLTCEIRADFPHRSSTNRSFVDGKATITCKGGAADRVSVTAVLELSRGGGSFQALPPVAGWGTTKNETNVNAGTPTTAVAAFACSDLQPGDKFRTTYKAASVTDKGKAVRLSVKGDNPNPPSGREVTCP